MAENQSLQLQLHSDHPQTAIDIRQDSKDENSKVKGGQKKRKKRDDDLDLDDIEAYFHNPNLGGGGFAAGQGKPPLTAPSCWGKQSATAEKLFMKLQQLLG
ncbi:hypothetical protein PtB15_16B263 [Puccinia triticina]|nr:hypothetical protein PtB15_16B263 [Puccinia triticina]